MTRDAVSLALETAKKQSIPNAQQFEVSASEAGQHAMLERKWGLGSIRRTTPTPRYNCHGLAFASRRTCIFEGSTVALILVDDGYVEVPVADVLPGDVVLYYDPDTGDAEHSGIVVEVPMEGVLRIPIVCSKWGKYGEVLHRANNCPYNYSMARYFRCQP